MHIAFIAEQFEEHCHLEESMTKITQEGPARRLEFTGGAHLGTIFISNNSIPFCFLHYTFEIAVIKSFIASCFRVCNDTTPCSIKQTIM